MSDGVRLPRGALTAFATACFAAEGLPQDDARVSAEALVRADARGIKTHGVMRIPQYAKRLRAGLIAPRPEITTLAPMPVSRVIDAGNALGLVAAQRAVEACLEAAETTGIGAATVRNANHFGAAQVWTLQAAAAGCIGLAMAPGARTLAPHGAREALFGTNPFAAAAPAGRFAPWSLDMAASVAARGHIRLADRAGHQIPEGWALDEDGRPTTDAAAALRGVVLPFAGAKGSGLAGLVDILAGVLSGGAFAGGVRDWIADFDGPAEVGHFFLAMKVEAFLPLPEFEARMETSIERLKALPPAEGFDEVLYPGERAARAEAEAETAGVPLTADCASALRAHGTEIAVPFPA